MADLKGYEGLRDRFRALQGPAKMKLLGMATVREAKILVHRKTGTTGRSIHLASATAERATVTASAAAPFLEFGTRPHVITPKAARALRWAASPAGRRLTGSPRKGAAVVFATRVNHPGTKPYPFMVPGARKAIEVTGADVVVNVWNEAD